METAVVMSVATILLKESTRLECCCLFFPGSLWELSAVATILLRVSTGFESRCPLMLLKKSTGFGSCSPIHLIESTGFESCDPILLRESTRLECCCLFSPGSLWELSTVATILLRESTGFESCGPNAFQGVYGVWELWFHTPHGSLW